MQPCRCKPSMHGSPPTFLHTNGEAAVAPPGGSSIRRPPKVCQRRARLISNWLCPITAGQSRHSFEQFDLKCSFPYPFLSPGAWGSPEPSSKKSLSASCWLILVVFFAFPTAPVKWHRKNIEKSAKIKDFGFPNPAQTPPQILSKSRSQKTWDFSPIFVRFFLILKTSKPWKYQFYLGKITIFKVFAKIVFLQLSWIFGQKNLPKTLPKRGPNPS